MKVEYIPKLDQNYSPIAGRLVAFAALLPDDHTKDKKWEWMLSVHGIGERSAGTQEHLENLVLGQKQADGSRKWPYVTDDMKRAVDLYKIVIIVPTYESNAFFDANRTDYVYRQATQLFSLASEYWYDGFSYGGGAAVNAATSSLTAANIAFCTPCAPTRSIGNAALVAQYQTPIHIFVNDQDDNGSTNLSVTKAIIAEINKYNPIVPAVFTAFRKNNHGGHNEALTIAPPIAPGGQGITDAAENLFTLYLDIRKNGPRQMRSGSAPIPKPDPTPIPVPQPVPNITPVTSYTIDDKGIHLKGDKSIGYKSGMDGKWEFVSGPEGATVYNVFPKGSTYINADGVLPVPGTYVFRFILKGASPVEVTVVHGTPEKKPISFEGTGLLTYSDQSTETITISFSEGKLVVKNSGGQILNL